MWNDCVIQVQIWKLFSDWCISVSMELKHCDVRKEAQWARIKSVLHKRPVSISFTLGNSNRVNSHWFASVVFIYAFIQYWFHIYSGYKMLMEASVDFYFFFNCRQLSLKNCNGVSYKRAIIGLSKISSICILIKQTSYKWFWSYLPCYQEICMHFSKLTNI